MQAAESRSDIQVSGSRVLKAENIQDVMRLIRLDLALRADRMMAKNVVRHSKIQRATFTQNVQLAHDPTKEMYDKG